MFISSTLVSDGASLPLQSWWREVSLRLTKVMDKDMAQCAAGGVLKLSLAGFYGQVNAAYCILPALLRER